MNSRRPTQALGWLGVGLAFYLIPGVIYWRITNADIARCLWGDPVCSLSVGTYFLVLITGLAFVAAYFAAVYAFKTFEVTQRTLGVAQDALKLEVTTVLAVTRKETNIAGEIDIVVRPNYSIENTRPSDDDCMTYLEIKYEFTSLGRTPIVQPEIPLNLSFIRRDDKSNFAPPLNVTVHIPSLKTDGSSLVTIWVPPDLLNYIVLKWEERATQMNAKKRVPLDFHSAKEERPQYRGLLSFSTITSTGDVGILAQPPIMPAPTTPVPPSTESTTTSDSAQQSPSDAGEKA